MSMHRDPQSAATTESDENLAAWEAGVQRMKETLQARRPDLFDENGELVMERAMALMKQAADDRGLTFTELYEQATRDFIRQADAS